ncbi:non-homologous end-joining DNA ligase [Sandaracinus amylolyticus]|uniref:non-homologous end-joining DNA ligase n=1 Tax=Sandaracinus amylolyticus TaxID=927083 RepID=UPI001F027F50|nr:non-homologous end-joining DNA ligase [Sandaracinus amylolyticus]UJR79999.1 DNA polymerase LigD ligase subunit [Sandaracinus amylolyticus]
MPRALSSTTPRRTSKRGALPEVEAQLATLVDEPPEGDAWLHEIKFDGYRALAYLDHGDVRLVSRNGLSFNERFAPVCAALARLPIERAILDGELCAIDEAGRTHFEALQQGGRHGLVYFVFDLLFEGDEDLRRLPLIERKERLARLLPETSRGMVRRAEHVRGDGASFLDAAAKLGLEGLIAKRVDRPYLAGRSLDWQKVKVQQREELVIVGFTPPKGARQRFGSLLLGTVDPERDGSLRYAGKVGTGFDTHTLEDLYERMVPLRVEEPPVIDPPREKGATWIRPELVAEVRYTEWTRDGKLRHPAFLGMREDKRASDVRRERATTTTGRARRR